MTLLGLAFWVLQIALLVHVFKTGRPFWWFFILLFAPGIGVIAYLLVEILPGMRRPDAGFFSGLKPRSWRIRELRAQLEETDVVRTRLELARELLEAGETRAAHAVAREALQGVFRNDPHTLVTVARLELAIDQPAEALELLQRVRVESDRLLENEKLLLEGRAQLGLGRLPEAEERFRYLQGRYVGDEPYYFLGLTLLGRGAREEAAAIWHEITRRYRRARPAWRRSERRWYQLARARLRELEEGARREKSAAAHA